MIGIFDNIDESDALCIIISKFSIESNWVKEELDAGVIRKITQGTKIIPILIEEVPLPNSLKHVNHVQIEDMYDYSEEFDEILSSITGEINKPPLGNPPLYLGSLCHLDEQELNIFNSLGEYCLKNLGFHIEIMATDISAVCDYDDEKISDSLTILINEGLLVSAGSTEGLDFTSHAFTIKGFYMYLKTFIKDYENICKKVIKSIVNGCESIDSIMQNTKYDEPMVTSLLWLFRKNEFIICNAQFNIMEITPTGKRYFEKELHR